MRSLSFIFLLCSVTCVLGQTKFQKDFSFYWEAVNDNFAYFDSQKTDWNKVKGIYQSRADTISSMRSFVEFLESVNNELYNGHVSLNTNLRTSNRLIPTGSDLWVNYQQNQFIVSAVREGFASQQSGLKTGMRITQFNGKPMKIAVQEFLPKSVAMYDERMYEYAGNMLLAGHYHIERRITVLSNGVENVYQPDSFVKNNPKYTKVLEYRRESANIGYIKINNSLGNNELINAFDAAVDSLLSTEGLIIDLRETPSGGNTTVARAIMSRFITKEMPYQKHSIPSEEAQYGVKRSWVELVSPRGKIYPKPIIVLVNRWTGSMGEGIAIGFDGMKRAQIVGDKMAGLLGAIYSYTLPETKIGFSIPAEKMFHVNGMRREEFVPVVHETDSRKQLATAISLLAKK